MTTRNEDVGHRLKLIRGELSQAAFAEKVGVHKNTLGGYERGERSPDAEMLRALVGLGYNANWVLTGEGTKRINHEAGVYTAAETPQTGYEQKPSIALDESLLQRVIAAVKDCEADLDLQLSARAMAKVVAILYKSCSLNSRDVDRQTVLEMVELAAEL